MDPGNSALEDEFDSSGVVYPVMERRKFDTTLFTPPSSLHSSCSCVQARRRQSCSVVRSHHAHHD